MNLNDWLKRERDLLDKATPGPWHSRLCNSGDKCWCRWVSSVAKDLDDDSSNYIVGDGSVAKNNAEFIANVRTSHAEALDTIERLQAENAQLVDDFDNRGRLLNDQTEIAVKQKTEIERQSKELDQMRELTSRLQKQLQLAKSHFGYLQGEEWSTSVQDLATDALAQIDALEPK